MIEDLDCVFMCSKCHFWACCNSEVIQNDQDMDWSFQENGTILKGTVFCHQKMHKKKR